MHLAPALFALALALPLSLLAASCDRPLVVTADGGGLQRLSLSGERAISGTVTRTLSWQGHQLAKGTEVRVDETWLVRKDGMQPTGYRINGLYDPTTRSDGLSLARHAVETYYVATPLHEAHRLVPIPERYFARRP
jgi:hypothetical protein